MPRSKPGEWTPRDTAACIIRHVLKACAQDPAEHINRVLRSCYPWGELKGWRYKMWRQEVVKQWADGKRVVRRTRDQLELFGGPS